MKGALCYYYSNTNVHSLSLLSSNVLSLFLHCSLLFLSSSLSLLFFIFLLTFSGAVASSPHDEMAAGGGVKQHMYVERAAADAAFLNSHCTRLDRVGAQGAPVAICRQWWKAKVDGTLCACDEGGGKRGQSQGGKGGGRRDVISGVQHEEGGVEVDKIVGMCGRRHFFQDAAEVAKFALLERKRRNMQERERAEVADDPHSADSKQSKAKSDKLFVEWLVATYGQEQLRQGGGVVDVAGGRGEVAFRLVHDYNIPCTLIDPRPVRLTKHQRKGEQF
jgi:hypothetical protein